MKDGAVVLNPEFGLIWFSGFKGEELNVKKNGRQMTVADRQAMTNT